MFTPDSYRAERDALLDRLTRLLEQDRRVSAAWLFGSLGRGTSDDLSDLDLIGVVADEHIAALTAEHDAYAAQAGQPWLSLDVPQNAPEGGSYRMLYYASPPGPLQVDWYWQPQSTAAIPNDTRVLFNRVGLPRHPGPTVFTARPGVQADTRRPQHFLGFAWAMLLITAKYAARAPQAERMDLLRYVLGGLHQAHAALGWEAPTLAFDQLPDHRAPITKIELLRRVASDLTTAMAALAARGETVPEAMAPGVERYLALIEGRLRAG